VITRRLNHTASKTVDIVVYERRRRRRTLEHARCRAVSRAVCALRSNFGFFLVTKIHLNQTCVVPRSPPYTHWTTGYSSAGQRQVVDCGSFCHSLPPSIILTRVL